MMGWPGIHANLLVLAPRSEHGDAMRGTCRANTPPAPRIVGRRQGRTGLG